MREVLRQLEGQQGDGREAAVGEQDMVVGSVCSWVEYLGVGQVVGATHVFEGVDLAELVHQALGFVHLVEVLLGIALPCVLSQL